MDVETECWQHERNDQSPVRERWDQGRAEGTLRRCAGNHGARDEQCLACAPREFTTGSTGRREPEPVLLEVRAQSKCSVSHFTSLT